MDVPYSSTYFTFYDSVNEGNTELTTLLVESFGQQLKRDLLAVRKYEEGGAKKVRELLLGAHDAAVHHESSDARLKLLRIAKQLHSATANLMYNSMLSPMTRLHPGYEAQAFACWHTPTWRHVLRKPPGFAR